MKGIALSVALIVLIGLLATVLVFLLQINREGVRRFTSPGRSSWQTPQGWLER